MSRFSPRLEERFLIKLLRQIGLIFAVGLVLFGAFFIAFVVSLPRPTTIPPKADGIVVFTGTASERLVVGFNLLEQNRGKRLLISGVYDDQTFETIMALSPPNSTRVHCCLDLDYEAKNTLENAEQTTAWVNIHGYRSVIIVTSSHHMPRAFLELRRIKPNLRLSAYPVVPEKVHLTRWWLYPGTLKLLFGEYVRYIWALAGLPNRG